MNLKMLKNKYCPRCQESPCMCSDNGSGENRNLYFLVLFLIIYMMPFLSGAGNLEELKKRRHKKHKKVIVKQVFKPFPRQNPRATYRGDYALNNLTFIGFQ
jgi:hypothetical protein